MLLWLYVCLNVCLYICLNVCLYICMFVWMYVCMNVCLYVCVYVIFSLQIWSPRSEKVSFLLRPIVYWSDLLSNSHWDEQKRCWVMALYPSIKFSDLPFLFSCSAKRLFPAISNKRNCYLDISFYPCCRYNTYWWQVTTQLLEARVPSIPLVSFSTTSNRKLWRGM
jgi:hypothetical protein